MATPEDKARQLIDAQHVAAGWCVQDRAETNLGTGLGVAVREFPLGRDEADDMLFVDRRACGIVEAKKEGVTLSVVAEQADACQAGLPAHVDPWTDPLRFDDASGSE